MPRWGDFARPARFAALVATTWGLSACGLVVGFGRDCVDDCASSTSDGGNALDGGSSSNGSGEANTSSGAGSGNSSGSGGAASASVGGNTAGAMGGSASTATTTNGSDGTGGGSTGGNGTGSDGTGGGSTGGNGTGGDGTGGGSTGGSGGGNGGSGADTSNTGGSGNSSTGGGTGGGGTLPDAACALTDQGQIPTTSGVRPVQVSSTLGGNNRSWLLTWREGSSVYFRGVARLGGPNTTEFEIGSTADGAGIPVIAGGDSEKAAVAFSQSMGTVNLNLYDFYLLAPGVNAQTPTTPALGGGGSSVTSLAAVDDSTFLLAGIHGGDGIVALFEDGAYSGSTYLGGSDVTSLAAVWMGSAFQVVFIDGGSLNIVAVPPDTLEPGTTITFPYSEPDGGSPKSYVRAVRVGTSVAAVWTEAGSVMSALLNPGGGFAAGPVVVASGSNNQYPNIAKSGSRLAVSWLDGNSSKLTMLRLEDDLTRFEQPLVITQDVEAEAFGFGGDQLGSDFELYAAAYNTTSVELTTIQCNF